MMTGYELIECVISGHGAVAPHRSSCRWCWHCSNLRFTPWL